MTENASLCCSSHIGQMMLEGIQEVVGRADLSTIFDSARLSHLLPRLRAYQLEKDLSIDDLNAIRKTLEDNFGPAGSRGIVLRAGRASFNDLLNRFGDSMEITRASFRLLPTRRRITVGLKALATAISSQCSGKMSIKEDERYWYWHIRDFPECYEQLSVQALCSYMTGILQEYLAWADGRHVYHVVQAEAGTQPGDVCFVRIDKRPID